MQHGEVNSDTWDRLFPYLNGYTSYTILNGDSLFSIALKFQTSISRILYANPDIKSTKIYTGQKIIVPFISVVPTDVRYTYDLLKMNLFALKRIYPFLEIQTIGKSILNKNLYVVRIGKGQKEVFYNASFHANEWITTPVLMKFIENYCLSYDNVSDIYGYQSANLFNSVSLYLLPMVNPDGVDLVTGALSTNSNAYVNAKQISR